ncbi:VWA domain-containing protein [Cryobacterium sp. 1639]|uniref:VWA domain-containing protein n=1 Tax=Cryobacterium inferilacus TaxID=2866629 RepID=UPI001C735A2F|nr:VWA domain-containing protein [Cryobacterium sp. 1639]MBX0301814.1 VWA domain-containing protein [Cryobacterium sp. 1639]
MTPNEAVLGPQQRAAWQSAQALWGVDLHDPELAPDAKEASFAWFTFPPQVTFDLPLAERLGVGEFLESIFAHEIGHHALSPSTRLTGLKIRHQIARALAATDSARIPDRLSRISDLSNLWSDMLINVRVAELQRRRDAAARPAEMLRMWAVLAWNGQPDRLWWVILHAYEILWTLPAGSLCPAEAPAVAPPSEDVPVGVVLHFPPNHRGDPATLPGETEEDPDAVSVEKAAAIQAEFDELAIANPAVDSRLLADTVRAFGDDPVSGALRFGMLVAPYLIVRAPTPESTTRIRPGLCTGEKDAPPATAAELEAVLGDARMQDDPQHPAVLTGRALAAAAGTAHVADMTGAEEPAAGSSTGQGYGLADTRLLYQGSDENAVIAAWYQARARAFVRPLLQRSRPPATTGSGIPGPLEGWDLGDDLTEIDWSASLARSVTVVPGVTTRRREELPDEPPVAKVGLDLDLYIDSSGSMTHPSRESSAVLAGTILILSVLRGRGRVRVTSFSGAGQVAGGERFTRDRAEALRDLTSFFNGGTVFPLDLYAKRYRGLGRSHPTVRRHVVVLSDEGLLSMFGQGQPGFAGVAAEVRRGLDTATLILQDAGRSVTDPAAAAGYDVEYINRMDEAPAVCARLARRLAEREPRGATPGRPARPTGGFRG